MSDTSEKSPRAMTFNELMAHNERLSAQTQDLIRRVNRVIADDLWPIVSRNYEEQIAADQYERDTRQEQ